MLDNALKRKEGTISPQAAPAPSQFQPQLSWEDDALLRRETGERGKAAPTVQLSGDDGGSYSDLEQVRHR